MKPHVAEKVWAKLVIDVYVAVRLLSIICGFSSWFQVTNDLSGKLWFGQDPSEQYRKMEGVPEYMRLTNLFTSYTCYSAQARTQDLGEGVILFIIFF